MLGKVGPQNIFRAKRIFHKLVLHVSLDANKSDSITKCQKNFCIE